MRINIEKAYKYYTDNIDKSDNKQVLDPETFKATFSMWLNSLAMTESMNPGIEEIPVMMQNGKTKIISLKSILNKIK